MPDYNIYVHAIGGGSNANNQTIPWSKKDQQGVVNPNEPWSKAETGRAVLGGVASFMGNPDTIASFGLSVASKAVPAIAAAFVSAYIFNHEIALDFSSLRSGDYREKIQWQDGKNALQRLTHPFGSVLQYKKELLTLGLQNDRKAQQIELLGDSVINSYTNRGV